MLGPVVWSAIEQHSARDADLPRPAPCHGGRLDILNILFSILGKSIAFLRKERNIMRVLFVLAGTALVLVPALQSDPGRLGAASVGVGILLLSFAMHGRGS